MRADCTHSLSQFLDLYDPGACTRARMETEPRNGAEPHDENGPVPFVADSAAGQTASSFVSVLRTAEARVGGQASLRFHSRFLALSRPPSGFRSHYVRTSATGQFHCDLRSLASIQRRLFDPRDRGRAVKTVHCAGGHRK